MKKEKRTHYPRVEYEFNKLDLLAIIRIRHYKKDTCVYCNEQLTSENFTWDHFIPRFYFRRFREEIKDLICTANKLPCCYDCNRLKYNMLPLKFCRYLKYKKNLKNRFLILQNMKQLFRDK